MKIYCNGITDVGGRSGVNQDSFGMYTDGEKGIFVVADGMGGHTYGEVASAHIVRAVADFWKTWSEAGFQGNFSEVTEQIQTVLQNASAYINMNYNQESICGSTVVLLFLYQEQYAVLSVGDSRIYQMDQNSFCQLTDDDVWDNLPNVIVEFTEEERAAHKNHGKLTQAMGATPNVLVHTKAFQLDEKKVFMLVSDGMYQYSSLDSIANCMRQCVDPDKQVEAMQALIEEVFRNGAGDNLSCVVVLA